MNIRKIPEEISVKTSCMPVYLEGGSTACLLIHGFTGYPGEMYFLGEKLNAAGFTVSIPRLPGHGTNIKDFLQTDGNDWLRRCIDAYLELDSRYDRVYICGLSLGGILAILLASSFNPAGCVLYAPGIAVKNRLLRFTPILKYFIRRLPTGYSEKSEDPDRLYLAEEYWKYRYAVPVSEVYKLQKRARKSLKNIHCDTLVFVSRADNTVSEKAADLVKEGAGSNADIEVIRLERSGHVLTNDSEREWVADSTIAWLENKHNTKTEK